MKLRQTCNLVARICVLWMAGSCAAHADTITFAAGQYDNTANTVTGTNAAPIYNNKQTTGLFRDVFWYGNAYNGGNKGVGSPDFINSGSNLVSNGGSPARARPFGNDTALNFTGQRIGGEPAGASFLTVYDTTPGDGTATRDLFDATGGLTLSTDILFAPGGHAVGGGLVALYAGGQNGLALVARNGGGNNPDVPNFSLLFQQDGLPTTLTSVSLPGNTFIGDTVGGLGSTAAATGDHWYRIIMTLVVTGDSYSVQGNFWTHTNAEDPSSGLASLITSLAWTGSLTSPGNALDLTNPGEIGLMAFSRENFGDGLGNGGTGADPLTDNIGISFTNFTFPEGGPPAEVPEPGSLALVMLGLAATGISLRRRKNRQA